MQVSSSHVLRGTRWLSPGPGHHHEGAGSPGDGSAWWCILGETGEQAGQELRRPSTGPWPAPPLMCGSAHGSEEAARAQSRCLHFAWMSRGSTELSMERVRSLSRTINHATALEFRFHARGLPSNA